MTTPDDDRPDGLPDGALPGLLTQADLDHRRLRLCVERWPDALSGTYDPRCCRFPKSCSPHGYLEAVAVGNLTDADLEPLRLPAVADEVVLDDQCPITGRLCDRPCGGACLRGQEDPPGTWALYGFTVPDGRQLAGCWMQVLVGPIRPPHVVLARMSGELGPPLLATWDHRPTDDEVDAVLPPEAADAWGDE